MKEPGRWLAACALAFFPFTADNFELPKLLVLAAGATVLAPRTSRPGRDVLRLAALWLGVSLLGTVTSSSPLMSLPALVEVVVLCAFALASGGFSARPLLIAAWPITAWALAQRLGLDPLAWSRTASWCGELRPFASLGHPGQLGVWAALVLPLALEEAHRASTTRARALALASAACCAACSGLALARAGWLAAGVGAAAWLLLRRPRWALPAAGLTAALLGAVLLTGGSAAVRLAGFFVAPTRLQLLRTGLDAFRAHPFFGLGLDTFTLASQRHRPADAWLLEWGTTPQHAHALAPQVLATLGLTGALALAVAVGVLLRAAWRWRGRAEALAGALAASAGFAAASLVTFHGVAVMALGVCCLAEVLGAEPAASGRAPWPGVVRVVSALALLWTARLAVASGFARAAMDSPTPGAGFLWAERLEPESPLWHALRGQQLERAARHGDTAQLAPALREYQAAAKLEPQVAQYQSNVARALALAGDPGALALFTVALAQAPYDGRIQLDAAEAAIGLKAFADADERLAKLLALYPKYGRAWWTLAALRAAQGRTIEERAALEAAQRADWSDWPEGAQAAQLRLAQVLAQQGDPAGARAVLTQPAAAAPSDICGAPRRLELDTHAR